MGYIIKNGTNYSSDNSVTLTQAQYDALVQAGTVEPNTTYFITDGGGILSIDMIYPIGSIYISVNNVNPGTYLTGTTWVAFASGRTLVGVDTSDTDFDTVEETGGVKSVTLTAAQSGVPSHTHSVTTNASNTGSGNKMSYRLVKAAGDGTANNHTTGWNGAPGYTDRNDTSWPLALHTHSIPALRGTASGNTATNASQAHNNMQPYITTYMWKRVS